MSACRVACRRRLRGPGSVRCRCSPRRRASARRIRSVAPSRAGSCARPRRSAPRSRSAAAYRTRRRRVARPYRTRAAAAQPLSTSRRTSSPTACPSVSLIVLEPVEIHDHDRERSAVAPGDMDRLLQPVVEQRAVRQARQAIFIREPEDFLLVRRNALLHVIEAFGERADFVAAFDVELRRVVSLADPRRALREPVERARDAARNEVASRKRRCEAQRRQAISRARRRSNRASASDSERCSTATTGGPPSVASVTVRVWNSSPSCATSPVARACSGRCARRARFSAESVDARTCQRWPASCARNETSSAVRFSRSRASASR